MGEDSMKLGHHPTRVLVTFGMCALLKGVGNVMRYKRIVLNYGICRISLPLTIIVIFSSENLVKQERFDRQFGWSKDIR